MSRKTGQSKPPPLVKAGCGVRFDPEQLDEDTGFDFSGAADLLKEEKAQQESDEREQETLAADEKKPGEGRAKR
ncbi:MULTISPECIES: hypothetical protein [unclassified Hahella]|uniref:hypothetical protein n=1 Tax=unclassified Hahella TaxID=2624107 RepID=UPI001C1E982C|nr:MULTISPECIES: hypothetical protein [unclassified Hahella]MBU6954289.1 hypothetical protein [Hahella sp. HN01]MDG9672132.1 hypothetical protein [Hahella sp. CR1]